jgi:hypothetical protein
MSHATPAIEHLQRVCVKIYAPEPGVDDQVFVPIFHEWIRDNVFGEELVLFDVADYAHVPDSPGVVLVTHEAHFALDRSDGRFGLLVQRRVPGDGGAGAMLADAIRHGVRVAERLAADPRIGGRLTFDTSTFRVEANDRLRAPNTEDAYRAFEPIVRAAVARAFDGARATVTRVGNDPRDRLAADVRVA